MVSRVSFHRFNDLKEIMRPKSIILISLALTIAFSSLMPTQVMAIWPFDPPKRSAAALSASEVKTAATQAIAEPGNATPKTLEKKPDRTRVHEIESLRTPFTSTYMNKDGTKTMHYSADQQNYKTGNKWEKINNTLQAVTDPAQPLSLFEKITNTAPAPADVKKFTGKAGKLGTQMKPLSEGIDIAIGDKSINMRPIGANNVKPTQKDPQTVVYKDAWKDVDLEYELRGESIKEIVVLKKKVANPVFDFKVTGGKVIQHPTKTGLLTIEGTPEDFTFSSLTVDVNERGVISEERATQKATKDGIQIALDKAWVKTLKTGDFPIRIDPSFGRDATHYSMRKSDGYGCGSSNCYANTGTLSDGGWKHWRTYFHFPFSDMAGKTIVNANLHGFYKTGVGGTGEGRTIWMGRAHCTNGFHCYSWDVGATGGIGGDFDINFTGGMQDAVNTGDWGRWWGLHGEEGPYKSFKPYWNLQASITYDTPTPVSTPVFPENGQVIVDTQPSLRVNPVGDADGDGVQYYFRVATGSNGETGAVINSGWITSNQWTIPDGILQDGTTYYWRVYTHGARQTDPNWTRSFKVDLRTGKDSTQAYDTVGPVDVALATGNATTNASTHTMNALGGSIGLNLDYDSPAKTKKGLIGEYWNVPSGYNFASGAPNSTANITRNDQTVNFDWGLSNPNPGVITDDWFYTRWKGNFIVPVTGDYIFGGSVDDNIEVLINGQKVFGRNCCIATADYAGATPVTLQAGQIVPIQINYLEVTHGALARVYVKGAVPEQVIPRDWLKTEVKAEPAQYGLMGRYYTDDGSHNFPGNDGDPMRLMTARNDSKLSFNWGNSGPLPGLQGDKFLVRWTGYITVPTDGSYTLGATADDGVRIKVNNGPLGAENTLLNAWQDQSTTIWGSATNLPGGKQVPITVEYFENAGGASFTLRIQGNGYPDQEIPVTWLTPKAVALPDAWRLGVDVDGDVNYERLRVAGQDVILEDSTRLTHTYTWTGNGFKPPLNEDGQLTRNADNSYTLLDTDGKTYVFDAEGKLKSVSAPTDDRNPAALKYTYGESPSRLLKISDGVTDSRYGDLHYRGVNENGYCSVPSGFDAAPAGMLCAFRTSDGDVTRLYYKQGQLSRVEKPGLDITDFGYDNLGRINIVRDGVANDAIAASIRVDDDTVRTELSYDAIGRVSAVKAPAPTASAERVNHTFDYKYNQKALSQLPVIGSTPVPGTITAVSWGENRIDLFARGVGDDLIHKWADDGKTWSAWESLGGCIREKPAVTSWKPGRLDIFAKNCATSGNLLSHKWYEGQWGGWGSPSSFNNIPMASAPSAVSWSSDRLDFVVRGTDNKLYHGYWSPATGWSGGGSPEANLCTSGTPTITSGAQNELDIYVTGCENSSDKTISKITWRNAWSAPAAQAYTGVSTHAIASRADIGATSYKKADGSAYARIGDQSLKVSDCSIDAPTIITVKTTMYAFFTPCGSTDTQQVELKVAGVARMHITGTAEPNGFSKKVDFDHLLRTIRETDVTNVATLTEWDNVKDLQLSTTDGTGLKSTTIYDKNDNAIENYGPAPVSWFGADRKPLAGKVNDIPKTSTGYDEGIVGPAVSWFNYKARPDTSTTFGTGGTLIGTPRLYATGINASAGVLSTNIASPPVSYDGGYTGLGFRMTGKLYLPNGTYWINAQNTEGVRVWIDDQLVLDSWQDAANRTETGGSFTVANGDLKRFKVDTYRKNGSTGDFNLYLKQDNGFNWTNNWSQWLKPDYNLKTSETAYDSQMGNVTTTTTYNRPEYGSVDKTVVDPNGQNLQTTSTYEAPGTGFLRQTSKTLPGGGTTNYQHYPAGGAEALRDNPCTSETESIHQGGRPKSKIEADPDGSGPQISRTSETRYNASGEVVATRYNDDNWTCTEYDNRGRVQRTIVPALGGKTGRTTINDYAKDGNPLITTTTDDSGTIRIENDLLGRTVKYVDAKGKVTESTYDAYGKVTSRTSPVGIETYEYDSYDRLIKQKLDNVTFATITYDQYSRLATVQYPAGISLSNISRDALGRENGTTFTVNGQTYSDSIERYVSGDVKQGVENGILKNYSYDNVGRLTGATIGSNTFAYEFGDTDSTCSSAPGNNVNAGKNGNRTKLSINNNVTTYCYDMADRLIRSSDPSLTNAQYDSHGNTVSLGDSTHLTEFGYDSNDRNIAISSGSKKTIFGRDAQDRIVSREHKVNDVTETSVNYGFTGSGDNPDFLLNQNGDVIQKYVTLPGDVIATVKPQSQSAGAVTYSLPNIHSDVYLTVDADGQVKSSHQTGPFGEALLNQISPSNTADGTTWGYVGQHQKMTDVGASSISGGVIQMGARAYIPLLGRFLSVDPVEGGVENNYVYPPDPINKFDTDGKAFFIPIALFVGRIIVQHAAKKAMQQGLSQLAVNRVKGKVAEKVAFNIAKVRHPLSKVSVQKTVQTPHGRRVIDIRVTSRITKNIRAIEVKAGNSRYTKQQIKKDNWMKNTRGIKTTVWRFR